MNEESATSQKKKFSTEFKRRAAAGVLLVLLAIACKFLLPAKGDELETLVFSGNTMATTWQVKVVDKEFSEARKESLGEAIAARLEMVNTQMSPYHKGGDIYRLNEAHKGVVVKVHHEVLAVLQKAVEISELTGGAFDVTVGPLIRLWGFHDKKRLTEPPSEAAIKEAQRRIGYQYLLLDPVHSTVAKGVEGLDVDLSAIAKGRSVDMVAETLDANGESNYMVEVGGEIRCRGKNDTGVDWRIGIEKPAAPDDTQRKVLRVVPLSNLSMATSGDYRSYYMIHNKRYSHTIDPVSGKPVSHALASVSVLTEDCMTADALATGFTVLGVRESMRIADKRGYAAYFIEREQGGFKSYASRAFVKKFGKDDKK